ncbi:hypothetical protein [Demequina sp.]|uniref:fascin domain-containing protein n=1 Tax=Demequina sp. TaxID=2050685 RepID=UPI003D0B8E0B
MTQTRRRALISAAAIIGVGLTSFALTIPAQADVDADFASSSNASDPSYFECYNPVSPYNKGYCMVTSQDLGEAPLRKGQLGENYYPMSTTRAFFSSDGLKWTTITAALNETKLQKVVNGNIQTLSGTKHLWAPSVRTLITPGGRAERPVENYFLYTPDLLDKEDRFSSRIWVTYANNPYSGYGNTAIWGLPSGNANQQILGIPTAADIDRFKDRYPLYMSDPDVFTNTSAADNTYWDHEFDDYLLWADGDASSCGGLSIRKMTNQWTVQQFHDPNEAWLDIRGLNSGTDALGTCVKKYPTTHQIDIGRPYIEGGELFHTGQLSLAKTANEGMPGPYLLVFAAKPSIVPSRCTSANGEPNTSNEVIAYATASTVTGPYQYRGIIMCGSSTEWTNQATIEQVKAPDGTYRLVLVYHDGPAANENQPRNRVLHSECLYAVDNGFVKTQRSADGAASVSGAPAWCISNSKITALTSVSNGKYVNVNNSGNLQAAGQDVGVWEQMSRVTSGSYTYFKARNGNKYVGTSTTQLKADQTSTTTAARFTMEQVAGTKYRIKDSNGRYLQVQSNGIVKANSTAPSSTDTSYQFWLQTLTN